MPAPEASPAALAAALQGGNLARNIVAGKVSWYRRGRRVSCWASGVAWHQHIPTLEPNGTCPVMCMQRKPPLLALESSLLNI